MSSRISRLALWTPAALAGLFLLVLLIHQGAVRESLGSHADWVSAPVLAELFPDAPAGTVLTLGDYPWYEALWLLEGTRWLPGHHFVWEMVPFAIWLGTALLVAASTRLATGSRWASVTAGSLVICGGIAMRGALWSLNTHGPAAFHVALVGAAFLAIVARPVWSRGVRGYGGAAILGAVTALGATDPLVTPVALGPLLFAAAVLWIWRGIAAPLRLGLIVAAITVVGKGVLDSWGQDASITWTHKAIQFIGADGVVNQVGRLPSVVARLAGNSGFGQMTETPTVIAMGGGLIALLALAVVLHAGVRLAKPLVAVTPRSPRPGVADDADPGALRSADLWLAGLAFWLAVLVINLLAFVFTTAAFDAQAARYFVPGWLAVCVLMPALATHLRLEWLAALAATVMAASSLYGFQRDPRPSSESPGFPTRAVAEEIRAYAAQNGVKRSYGAFWDALPITWHTRFELEVYPIWECLYKKGSNCRFYEHGLSSWYLPKPGRSMLLVDEALPIQPVLDDPEIGEPVAQQKFGSITAYIYDQDLATTLN